MLYLVSTPIGNLKDISLRAIEILKSSDLILCEDTRRSSILLNEYQIKKPLKSLHKFSEAKKEEEIVSLLKEGRTIALISDAGTPVVSDPGGRLVKRCLDESLDVAAIPGPAAFVQALVCSGLSAERFQFIGFLPKKTGDLQKALLDMIYYDGTTICYESPRRIVNALEILAGLDRERPVVIAREMTKKFEEFIRGNAGAVLEKIKDRELKGEIVFLVEGAEKELWLQMPLAEHIKYLQETFQIPQKEAIKIAASLRHLPKSEVYREIHKYS